MANMTPAQRDYYSKLEKHVEEEKLQGAYKEYKRKGEKCMVFEKNPVYRRNKYRNRAMTLKQRVSRPRHHGIIVGSNNLVHILNGFVQILSIPFQSFNFEQRCLNNYMMILESWEVNNTYTLKRLLLLKCIS